MDLSSRVTKLNDSKSAGVRRRKRVIAWQRTYEMAFELLVHLNNKYALDGRDPNSYAGILWCFGKHDRPWFEREIFGAIRYMTSRSMAKKFNARRYMGLFGVR